MDRDQWRIIVTQIRLALKALGRPRGSGRFVFSDVLVVTMYYWSVAHDRAMRWACDRSNYNRLFHPRQLPSVSQFHRRVKSERVGSILQLVNDALSGRDVPTALTYIDGKALSVSPVTKDPDARVGYAAGGLMAKGYKLHAVVTEDKRLICWCVRPMNEHEMPVGRLMLDSLAPFTDRSLVLADGNYDSHVFYKAVHHRGGALVTHLRGKAAHPVSLRQMGPGRREMLRLDQSPHGRPLLRMALRHRNDIELTFSHLTSYGGGLGPLPAFVRRLPRVTRWIGAKITLYHARLALRKQRARNA
jgi:hypothetical protein